MQKSVLEQFIQKYSLNGAIDAVNWRVNDGVLSVTGTPQNTYVISFVDVSFEELSDGVYSIYDTTQLKSFLGVLGDDINITVLNRDDDGVPIGFMLDDKPSGGKTKIQFALSDATIIPKESTEAELGDPGMEITFDNDFMKQFIKSKSAFADLGLFTIMQDGDQTNIVIGYDSGMFTSSVTLGLDAVGSLDTPRTFSADYLREIFVAHKDHKSGTIDVYERGETVSVMRIAFDDDDGFNTRYYLLQVTKQV